jgi:hypothetical protein
VFFILVKTVYSPPSSRCPRSYSVVSLETCVRHREDIVEYLVYQGGDKLDKREDEVEIDSKPVG